MSSDTRVILCCAATLLAVVIGVYNRGYGDATQDQWVRCQDVYGD